MDTGHDPHYVVLVYCPECRHDQDPDGCFGGKSGVVDCEPHNLEEAIRAGKDEVWGYGPQTEGHALEFEIRDGEQSGPVVFSSEYDNELVSRSGELKDCDELLRRRAHRIEWEVT